MILQKIIPFIMTMVKKYNIDESHGLSHSLEIYKHVCAMMEHLSLTDESHRRIIIISALLHDMCDKKYGKEREGLQDIRDFLETNSLSLSLSESEISVIETIIQTMSYSKVMVNGFPNLGQYQMAYHIVREADLLCAYDINRCIMYHLHNRNQNLRQAVDTATVLLHCRMMKHRENGLLTLEYSQQLAITLEQNAWNQITEWEKVLRSSL